VAVTEGPAPESDVIRDQFHGKERQVRANTQSITIAAPPEAVFAVVADLARLPSWAIGFAEDIRQDGGRWLVRTGGGREVPIRVDADPGRGTVDYYMRVEPGGEVPAATRVVANGAGAEYVFTMFQPPGLPDEAFEAQIGELARELTVLKARVESSCPL
jgi:Polyketide cyclase / dehydrase and lipid transport